MGRSTVCVAVLSVYKSNYLFIYSFYICLLQYLAA